MPDNCWTEHFLPPLLTAKEIFLNKNTGNKAAEDLIEHEQYVSELYHKYKAYFGYAFYIGKKI